MSRGTNPALAAKLEAERRLKEGISGHRTGLPKKLLDLFAPLEPSTQLTQIKKPKIKLPYTGIAQHIHEFAEPGDPEYEPEQPAGCPASPRLVANPELKAQSRLDVETRLERKGRISKEKVEKAEQHIVEGMKGWVPAKDSTATDDPFKTLFVGRISYEATERKLRRDFEEYGPVKNIRLVHDQNDGKSRGYAFIEFEHKNDMKLAYKMADGKKIEGKRVVVDVERGRTVPNWRPRRFGGGKGGESRVAKPSKKHPLPAAAPAGTQPSQTSSVPTSHDRPAKELERLTEGDREHRTRDRERERPDRERERPDRERERSDREPRRDRDHGKGYESSRMSQQSRPPSTRDHDKRDMNGWSHGSKEPSRQDRDRKRERHERGPGERDFRDDANRASKRPKDDRSRQRERDLI